METIMMFILKALAAVTYIGYLILAPVFFVWLLVCLVRIILGKEKMSGHLPWYGWF